MHLSEEWEHPHFVVLSLFVFLLSFFKSHIHKLKTYALAAALIPFALDFPDLANHGNLMLILGTSALLLNLFGLQLHDEFFRFYLRPVLPVIYIFAGFHKLNTDFFNRDVSCANDFFLRYVPLDAATFRSHWLALILPFGAVTWELSAALFLHLRRTQIWYLIFSAMLHGFLAFHHFADFGSLMLAMFYLWIPPALCHRLEIPRVKAYFIALFLTACFLPLIPLRFLSTETTFGLVGASLIGAFAVFMWGCIDFKNYKQFLFGVRIWMSPRQTLLPLFIAAFSITPYLGLRTSGNLTMFSNLKTEGERSNHFLLGNNPFKVFELQEDQIKFVQVNPEYGQDRNIWLKDYALPATELYKKTRAWKKQHAQVAAVYWYRGQLFETNDLAADHRWQTDSNLKINALWQDFRVIQTEGANRCRW
jgi:hypothetical protein